MASTTTTSLASQTSGTTIGSNSTTTTYHCPSQAGAITGAAVGTGVGVGLLVAAAAFLLFRRKKTANYKSSNGHQYRDSQGDQPLRTSNGAAYKEAGYEVTEIDRRPLWERNLPQPADDNTVRARVRGLFTSVELHVDNYYRNQAVNLADEQVANLTKVDTRALARPIADAMNGNRTVMDLIKHVIAFWAVSSVLPDSKLDISLLPREMVALPRSRSSQANADIEQALSRWRVLTGFIGSTTPPNKSYLADRDKKIARLVSVLTSAFDPWVRTEHSAVARETHLTNVMRGAAEVGIMLATHPSRFEIAWATNEQGERQRQVVIMPALVKATDEEGIEIDGGQTLLKAIIRMY